MLQDNLAGTDPLPRALADGHARCSRTNFCWRRSHAKSARGRTREMLKASGITLLLPPAKQRSRTDTRDQLFSWHRPKTHPAKSARGRTREMLKALGFACPCRPSPPSRDSAFPRRATNCTKPSDTQDGTVMEPPAKSTTTNAKCHRGGELRPTKLKEAQHPRDKCAFQLTCPPLPALPSRSPSPSHWNSRQCLHPSSQMLQDIMLKCLRNSEPIPGTSPHC